MKLQRELDSIRAKLDATVERRVLDKLDRGVARLKEPPSFPGSLGVGDIAPDFELSSQHGEPKRLSAQLRRGPAVLVFVRGEWCPYCSTTIRAWQRMHPLVQDSGAAFLMISPQSRRRTLEMTSRRRLTYDILHDAWAQVAGQFGIAYEIEGDYRDFVQGEFGLDVGLYNGTLNWRVPVSATYVIDTDRRIVLAHVNPDHRVRLEPEEALVALARLRLARH